MRLLLVSNPSEIGQALAHGFMSAGAAVEVVDGAGAMLDSVANTSFDAIVLRRPPSDATCVEACRALRLAGHGTPVVVVADEVDADATVEALDAGADDYVGAAVDFDVLAARVRAVVRRCEPEGSGMLRYGGIDLDLENRRAMLHGEPIELTPREFSLLEYLLRHRDQVVSRAAIGVRVWGQDGDMSNVVDVYISRLRRKIPGGRALLQTIHGLGYRLAGEAG